MKVHRLIPRDQRLKADVAERILGQLDLFGPKDLPEQPREVLVGALQRMIRPDQAEPLWPGGFAMISKEQTARVWDAIRALPPDARPHQVRHAFDLVLLNLRMDTGEVMLTRDQLADKIGTSPDNISTIMGTLEKLGVIFRQRRKVEGMRGPGQAVYFLNEHVGWEGDLTIRKARAAKRLKPQLSLELIPGGAAPAPAE